MCNVAAKSVLLIVGARRAEVRAGMAHVTDCACNSALLLSQREADAETEADAEILIGVRSGPWHGNASMQVLWHCKVRH